MPYHCLCTGVGARQNHQELSSVAKYHTCPHVALRFTTRGPRCALVVQRTKGRGHTNKVVAIVLRIEQGRGHRQFRATAQQATRARMQT